MLDFMLAWTKAFVVCWVLLYAVLTTVESDEDPCMPRRGGACENIQNQTFPYMNRGLSSDKCRLYMQCSQGSSVGKTCSKGNYDWITGTCKNTTKCSVTENVEARKWDMKDHHDQELLRNGQFGDLRDPLKVENRTSLKLDDQESTNNQNYTYLLTTHFLSLYDGWFNFTGSCDKWCRVWVTEVNTHGCGERIRVFDHKYYGPHKSQTENITEIRLKHHHYYKVEAAYIQAESKLYFKIGVNWRYINESSLNVCQEIPAALLRFDVSVKCDKKNNTTPTQRPTTNARTTSPTPSSPSLPPTTRNKTPSTTEPALTTVSSTTLSTTTARRTTESPDVVVQNLAANVSDFLEATNQSGTPSASQQSRLQSGLSQVRYVDLRGENIAKEWTRRGESFNISYENVLMEVSFPLQNYKFPRHGVSLDDTDVDEEKTDQIFIPSHALVNTTGGFHRRMFSALYLNLNEKLPKYFNTVETQTVQLMGNYQLNSKIIASTAVPRITGLKNHDIVIKLVHLQTNFSEDVKMLCSFYKWRDTETGNGVWSTEGCIRDEKMSTMNVSVCRCNHLTHFGILMQMEEIEISIIDSKVLRLISYIGCALSLLGASLTFLAIACLPGARSDRNFIHVNLAMAIAFAQITFLAGIEETENRIICTIVAALLHYFLLAAFSWMLFEGIFLHMLIVRVFHDQLPKKRYYTTFCWGLPAIVVLLSSNLLRDGYGTETSCWLSTEKLTVWTFMGPAIVVITINIVILCKVMKEIGSLRTSGRREVTVRTVRDGLRSAIILLPLLGITWALGLICVNGSPIAFQYLFAIFNSLQGLFIFLFHCLFNSEVRKAFWRKVDLWFTTHHVFGSNGQSGSCSKKSKDNSFSQPTHQRTSNRNSGREGGSSENSHEEDPSPRKISCTTTSSYLDSWSMKTPNPDSAAADATIKAYPGRFTPTLADINDIRYGFPPLYNKPNSPKKTVSTPILASQKPPKANEDMNGNTHSLDDIHKMPFGARSGKPVNIPELPKIPEPVTKNGAVSVGIGGQVRPLEKTPSGKLGTSYLRMMDMNGTGATGKEHATSTFQPKTNRNGTLNGHAVPTVSTNDDETKL